MRDTRRGQLHSFLAPPRRPGDGKFPPVPYSTGKNREDFKKRAKKPPHRPAWYGPGANSDRDQYA